jgi:hypothetical protein
MVLELSKLASLIEEDSIPDWVREKLDDKATLEALQKNGTVTLTGPDGEKIEISEASSRAPKSAMSASG